MSEAQNVPMPDDVVPAEQARQEILKVNKNRLAELLDSNLLRWWSNPLDRRMKLISKAEAQELASRFPREQRINRPKESPMAI